MIVIPDKRSKHFEMDVAANFHSVRKHVKSSRCVDDKDCDCKGSIGNHVHIL